MAVKHKWSQELCLPCELELNPQNVLWLSLVEHFSSTLLLIYWGDVCVVHCSMNCTKDLHKSSSYFRSVKVNKSELVKLDIIYSIDIPATEYYYSS